MPFSALLSHLRADFPDYSFVSGPQYRWSPDARTITYDSGTSDPAQLLHELAHALLGHSAYRLDVELLKFEAAAWEHAQAQLAPGYSIVIDNETLQDHLDSYRQWLYRRSLCPKCHQTGLQTQKNTYSCINCRYSWNVNDAKHCQLRRTRRLQPGSGQ